MYEHFFEYRMFGTILENTKMISEEIQVNVLSVTERRNIKILGVYCE